MLNLVKRRLREIHEIGSQVLNRDFKDNGARHLVVVHDVVKSKATDW